MAPLPILMWPHEVLTETCAHVNAKDDTVSELVQNLFDTMYAAQGRGLAAPQIGVLQRVFVIDVTWKEADRTPIAFINPTVTAHSDAAHIVMEQCLSIPQIPMPVSRPSETDVTWDTVEGTRMSARFVGDEARCILHELDHLNGRTIFDHQSDEDRKIFEDAYAP